MNYTQLELPLLHEPPEVRHKREIAELKLHCEKLRKSLYAKNSELNKQVKSLKSDVEIIINAICKGKISP